MRIRLTKLAHVGLVNRPKGWEGEVDDALGRSIVNDKRAVEIKADKPPAKPKTKTAKKE